MHVTLKTNVHLELTLAQRTPTVWIPSVPTNVNVKQVSLATVEHVSMSTNVLKAPTIVTFMPAVTMLKDHSFADVTMDSKVTDKFAKTPMNVNKQANVQPIPAVLITSVPSTVTATPVMNRIMMEHVSTLTNVLLDSTTVTMMPDV
jgi:hypothetical protein